MEVLQLLRCACKNGSGWPAAPKLFAQSRKASTSCGMHKKGRVACRTLGAAIVRPGQLCMIRDVTDGVNLLNAL